ncbi:MAG: metal-dependent transcriptional regulator [Halobacteria archaeon]
MSKNEAKTESVEMYLKEIYLLSRDGSYASTGDIADMLEVSPPSVSEMLGNLEENDFIEYEKYKGARLTDDGERLAKSLLQKHCLIERFLVKFLEVDEGFHDEACRIEHVMSEEVAEQLSKIVDQRPECPSCYDPQEKHCSALFKSST